MFGTDESSLQRIENVLDRREEINSLDCLIEAMEQKDQFELTNPERIAIGIDSSAFLKLATNKNSADIIDYLLTQHKGPIVLPGQTIQEFWNNKSGAIQTLSSKLQSKLDTFKKEILDLCEDFEDFSNQAQELLEGFKSEHGYIYDHKSIRSIATLLNAIKTKAYVPYVPRSRFYEIARSRKLTKTPPGFQDDGDGDFFIWVEFLFGLMKAQADGAQFDYAILLTYDKKKDWSRGVVAHPILAAELKVLVKANFQFWDLEQFYKIFAPNPKKYNKNTDLESKEVLIEDRVPQ